MKALILNGSPRPNGNFFSTHFDKTMKVGASVVCARRGGCSATFDEMNKFFTISGMPVASSQYWNSIHGLAQNMSFLMKSISLGKEKLGISDERLNKFNAQTTTDL